MRATMMVALIAAFPPTLAAVLGYVANSRSLRRRVGEPTSVPLSQIVERVDAKVDALLESQTAIRERIARLEGRFEPRFRPGVAKR